MEKVHVKLFLTGRTARSEQALTNIKMIGGLYRKKTGIDFEISVFDVLEHPEMAEKMGIFATPTLIKDSPPPVRRIIGDLSDTDKVLFGLGLNIFNIADNNRE